MAPARRKPCDVAAALFMAVLSVLHCHPHINLAGTSSGRLLHTLRGSQGFLSGANRECQRCCELTPTCSVTERLEEKQLVLQITSLCSVRSRNKHLNLIAFSSLTCYLARSTAGCNRRVVHLLPVRR